MHEAGAFYHVLSRGNERRPVFRDGADYGHFLELLGETSERFGLELWSYVLMENHYHLVLRSGTIPLSRAMQWLGVAYSAWHNRRHDRSGHLFQGRFKAFAVTEEDYLQRLICYVHRNPVRAGIVERLADYPWSSYRALAYGKNVPGWLARDASLGLYGGAEAFRHTVQNYSDEARSLWEDLRVGTFLGSAEAWERFCKRQQPKAHREVPASRAASEKGDLRERVAHWRGVLGISGAEWTALCRPVRGQTRPLRDILMYALWSEGRHGLSEIGDIFGVGYTGIVNARRRAIPHLAKDARLRAAVDKGGASDK